MTLKQPSCKIYECCTGLDMILGYMNYENVITRTQRPTRSTLSSYTTLIRYNGTTTNFSSFSGVVGGTGGDTFNISAGLTVAPSVGISGHANIFNLLTGTEGTVTGGNFSDTFNMQGGTIT